MPLSDVNLSQLVAELQQRLRRFASGPPGSPVSPEVGGALNASGRAALACRLLAVALDERTGEESADLVLAFRELAGALDTASEPLPGSSWDEDLSILVKSLETLASSWDEASGVDRDLGQAWAEVRRLGDGVWGQEQQHDAPVPVEPVTSVVNETPRVWLLVAGSIRRVSLQRRLAAAGFAVDCLANADMVSERLTVESPRMVICDDAAPTRHHSCLAQRLGASPLPLVLVQSRTPSRMALDLGGLAWGPPYLIEDLLSQIDRL